MGGCSSTKGLRVPREKRFRRAIKLYEVNEVRSMTNLLNRNRCFESGDSPLTLASKEGHEAVVQELVDAGADVNKLDSNGKCPLHIAVQFNDEETVDILLSNKADPNRYDGYNMTPLHVACEHGHLQMVDKLLEAGARPSDDHAGVPAIIYALVRTHGDCVEALLENGASSDVTDGRGLTTLHIAVNNSDTRSVRALLKYGASPFAESRDGDTLVCQAALNSAPEVLQALVDGGCDVNAHNLDEPSAIIAASIMGSTDCVDVLINAGCETNGHDKKGHSPLYLTAMAVMDEKREMYFKKYFSNVYRTYYKYDPTELNGEALTKCAMSLVQGGSTVSVVWDKICQIVANLTELTYEQMVVCEVLVQAHGFPRQQTAKIRSLMASLIRMQEHGLLRLLYSVGVNPTWEDVSSLGVAAATDSSNKDIFNWVKRIHTHPRHLDDLCRQKIRTNLFWNVLYLVERLNVKQDIKDFICIMHEDHYSNV